MRPCGPVLKAAFFTIYLLRLMICLVTREGSVVEMWTSFRVLPFCKILNRAVNPCDCVVVSFVLEKRF